MATIFFNLTINRQRSRTRRVANFSHTFNASHTKDFTVWPVFFINWQVYTSQTEHLFV